MGVPIKVNNDVLIPRSILKKNDANRKDLFYKDIPDDLGEFDDLIAQGAELEINPNEGIVGRQLDVKGPILSPKTFNQDYLEKHYKAMEAKQHAQVIRQEAVLIDGDEVVKDTIQDQHLQSDEDVTENKGKTKTDTSN